MHLPTWEELTSVEEQLAVLEFPIDQSLFVVGPPGSGKTVLAVYRAQQAAEFKDEHDHIESAVAIVTFNRMLRRLLELIIEGEISVYTMQSYIWRDYHARIGGTPPRNGLDRYAYEWEKILTRLKNSEECPNMSHMVVDEGQDLPKDFFTYIRRYVSNTMTVFADEDQALRDHSTTLEDIKAATHLRDPIILQSNHRNTPEIARLAEHFHSGRLPVANVLRSSSMDLPRLVRSQSPKSTAERVSNWFKNRGGSIGVIVNQNSIGRNLYHKLTERLPERRIDIYEYREQNENSIDITASGVTILNKESVKGQEFDTVFILELERFIPCRNDTERRAMYMMCTRAKDHLFLVYGPDILSAQTKTALPSSDILEYT